MSLKISYGSVQYRTQVASNGQVISDSWIDFFDVDSRSQALVAARGHFGKDRLAGYRLGDARLQRVQSARLTAHQSLRCRLAWSGGG